MAGVALVIGNSKYQSLPRLRTPSADADAIADRLMTIGFDTYVTIDADLDTMRRRIAEFRSKVDSLSDDGSIIFYFSGHGVQWRGENYLLPVNQEVPTDGRWGLHGVDISTLLEEICWTKASKLIALDACRSLGLGVSASNAASGLAERRAASYGDVKETMILYSAHPGQQAQDGAAVGSSPFCRATLDALQRPDRPLAFLAADIARNCVAYAGGAQTPWKSDNLIDRMETPFWRGGNAIGAVADLGPRPGPPPVATEAVAPIPEPLPPLDKAVGRAVDAEVAKRGHLIHKIKAKDTTGRWAYYFVLVEPEREAAFLRSVEGDGTLDLEHYGKVIASSYGEEPTAEVRVYLKEKYGFDV